MEALDDDGRERSSHHYVPPSPGPSYLGPASVRWRTDTNQKKLPSVGPIRADPSSLSASERATTPPAAVPWRISCTKRELRCHLPAWRGCRTPWPASPAIYPMLQGVLRLSVALLASVAQHERGARQLTVAAITRQLVVSFREERTYGALPCPRLDGLRSVAATPTHVRLEEGSLELLLDAGMLGRRMMVGTDLDCQVQKCNWADAPLCGNIAPLSHQQ